MDSKLPEFAHPPVIEVVMGVQFQRLDRMLAPHIGKFWQLVEGDYPRCSENPPIIEQVEDFSRPGIIHPHRLEFSSSPDLPRVFLEDVSGQWLLQLQRDRFLHNWRAGSEGMEYPRYPAVNARFLEQWQRFQGFIKENDLGTIRITQLEMTYLNHIPLSSGRMGEVFPDLSWRARDRVLAPPESCSVFLSFKSGEVPKRLRATIKPVIQEGSHNMRLDLTVRGVQSDGESFEQWFADARAWIVGAFADLTSSEWHSNWGRSA